MRSAGKGATPFYSSHGLARMLLGFRSKIENTV
jgi:hypothetical protein